MEQKVSSGSWRRIRRIGIGALMAVGLVPAIGILFPPALAFPHRTQLGEITVYSVEPAKPELAAIVARAAALDAASEIAAPLGPRSIFLTDGGWRWRILSLPSWNGTFALTRPFSTNIVLNRSDIAGDAVYNGGAVAGRRTLSGTIAHETAHLLINRRYGVAAIGFASWKVEGYCDHVARESALSPEQAARLQREGKSVPALRYFEARQKVEAALAGGSSVDVLMRGK